jgi:hypothetical protein
MLGRVGGRRFLTRAPAYQREIYEAVRALALERYDEGVDRWLPFNLRLRSRLLRDGRYEGLATLAAAEAALHSELTVLKAASRGRGVLVRVEARVLGEDGPLAFEARGDRLRWVPPAGLAALLPDEALDATDDVAASGADLLLTRTTGGPEYVRPAETRVRHEAIEGRPGLVTPVVIAETHVDPAHAAGGSKLKRGDFDVALSVNTAGFTPPPGPAVRRRRGTEEPLLLTVTHGGRLLPPGLRRTALERYPGAVRALGRVRSRAIPAR